ncbi:hypothetical protein ULMS_05550 [Patiriisocius marinistellae]|uniref:DUF4347 domain-containing protein n=2 Tax=Patiriisocius marinistellae TaxID=2494560 RepID=A0A5J4FSI2_9FLAO|nr:hypothetical protein ULMS_05550 [Patiriisocius marinistellae]
MTIGLSKIPSKQENKLAFNTSKSAYKNTAQSIVFVAGFDEDDNTYYTNATAYFKSKNNHVVEGLYSLEEIINWLNTNANDINYKKIHIVTHSNAWRGMSLRGLKGGERITLKNIGKTSEMLLQSTLGVTDETSIVFHSCGLGNNPKLLKELKNIFSMDANPKVTASPYFNIFGGKYAAHYLAQPFYVFHPTAQSPGPMQLAQEIEKTYPHETIDWFTALKTREETTLGTPYSYRFNIPVEWEFEYESTDDIPQLNSKDAILDFVSDNDEMALAMYELNVPLEKFRWTSKISENTLKIYGKSTVLCVLKPVMDVEDKGNYVFPIVENTAVYTTL